MNRSEATAYAVTRNTRAGKHGPLYLWRFMHPESRHITYRALSNGGHGKRAVQTYLDAGYTAQCEEYVNGVGDLFPMHPNLANRVLKKGDEI